MHGGRAIRKMNTESERILEFAFANDLVVGNTWFKKKPEHLVTYQSGNAATKIEVILVVEHPGGGSSKGEAQVI